MPLQEQMLSIHDEECQDKLCASIRLGDGPAVARQASQLVVDGKARLVRRACLECVHMCHLCHAEAVLAYFVKPGSGKSTPESRQELSDIVATIMAGVREGFDAQAPVGSCRAAVDAILLMPGALRTLPNLSRLPARLGPMWSSLVALARDAVRAGTQQEPLVHNPKLTVLFEGRSPQSAASVDNEIEDCDLKLNILWAYSRERAPTAPSTIPHANITKHSQQPQERIVAVSSSELGPGSSDEITCILDSK